MKETFDDLGREAKAVGLNVNEQKMTVIVVEKIERAYPHYFEFCDYNFERVTSFKYLGSIVNSTANETKETAVVNRTYFVLNSHLVSGKLNYCSIKWTTRKNMFHKTGQVERKLLRRIIGPDEQ